MTKIETNTRFEFDLTGNRPLAGVVEALLTRGLSPTAVSARVETILAGQCVTDNAKANRSGKTVSVEWKPRKDGGKTTVKLAGHRFEFGDSPEARFAEICNRIESLAEMFVRLETVRLPEAILRHFAANDCCFASKEAAEEASKAFNALAEARD